MNVPLLLPGEGARGCGLKWQHLRVSFQLLIMALSFKRYLDFVAK